MYDAYLTIDKLAEDAANGQLTHPDCDVSLYSETQAHLENKRVSWAQWKKIDEDECERGLRLGKVRDKLCYVDEMIEVARR